MSVTQRQVYLIITKRDLLFAHLYIAEVSLEATYDPRQLNDYDPDIFDSDGARLVQQPMYDETAKLVTPREEPSVFTPGALVAAEAQLLIHHFLREPNANHVCTPPSYLR
jgi:hypothetical protein